MVHACTEMLYDAALNVLYSDNFPMYVPVVLAAIKNWKEEIHCYSVCGDGEREIAAMIHIYEMLVEPVPESGKHPAWNGIRFDLAEKVKDAVTSL